MMSYIIIPKVRKCNQPIANRFSTARKNLQDGYNVSPPPPLPPPPPPRLNRVKAKLTHYGFRHLFLLMDQEKGLQTKGKLSPGHII